MAYRGFEFKCSEGKFWGGFDGRLLDEVTEVLFLFLGELDDFWLIVVEIVGILLVEGVSLDPIEGGQVVRKGMGVIGILLLIC